MLCKDKALAWADVLRTEWRSEVEGCESGMEWSAATGEMFGDPGGCDSRAMLRDRREWAELLAQLHELEGDLGTLTDEWWNGPKMKKKPVVAQHGECPSLGYMLASMRDGEESVRRQQQQALERWECEQRNEHWTRRKEAEAQRANPERKFRIRRAAHDGGTG